MSQKQDDRRRQIALVTGADLRPSAPSGTRSYVTGLAKFLGSQGFDVDMITNGALVEPPSGCRVRPVRELHTPSSARFQRDLRKWAASDGLEGIDLLHFHRPDDFAAFLAVGDLPPAVCTLHGNPGRGVERRHGLGYRLVYRHLERAAMARLRAIIAIDQATAEDYRARYPTAAERIHVVPNAVGDEWVVDSSAGARARADGPPVFLFAGRLSVEKRVDLIIRAIAGSHGLSGAKLVIAGAGPEEARLRRLANGSEVQFLGEVLSRDLASLYRRVDALVLASEYEGLPTVMLEALASGCPVVAMSGWGAESLLRGGRGVVATQPQDLSGAMIAAVRMRREGQPIHLPIDFAWSRVGNRVLEIYERVWREASA